MTHDSEKVSNPPSGKRSNNRSAKHIDTGSTR